MGLYLQCWKSQVDYPITNDVYDIYYQVEGRLLPS